MKINPNRIGNLSIIATTLYEHANNAVNLNPNKAVEMHYVIDLLKDLVDTAYPMENNNIENEIDIRNLIKVAEFQSFDEMMEAVAEITKATKPPKAGEF